MIGPMAIAALALLAIVFLVLYFVQQGSPEPIPATTEYENFSDLALGLPEDHPIVQAINLPEEKFAPKQYTCEEILSKARAFAQDYASRNPNTPFITADFINHLMCLNGLPPLGASAGGFFRNRKLFAPTVMVTRSTYPPSRSRTLRVYRYVGPVSTAVN